MSVTEVQLYKSLKAKLGDETAQELVNYIKSEINTEFMDCKQLFLVKDDKADLIRTMKEDKVNIMRAIYAVGLMQFLAIMASLIAILSFFLKQLK
jgi:hypothetical protein